jgi:hypothetical protein
MLSHALYASFADNAEQRISDRRVLRLEARVATPSGEGGIEVHNLSRTGMLVECGTSVPVGSTIEVELPGGTSHRASVVWADEHLFGCRFDEVLTQGELSAALLRSAPKTQEQISDKAAHDQAMARLREYWGAEEGRQQDAPANDRLPLGTRLWVMLGLALVGWAVPAAAAWAFF